MCTLIFAHRAHADYPLVIVANRDEFYMRPTDPAHFWDDAPNVLAGRDRKAGGTWLGIARTGRWAGLTNVRDPGNQRTDALSRGQLVSDFLRGDMAPAAYAADIAAGGAAYNGFNLLVGDSASVWYVSNHENTVARPVAPGVHGVSNHLLDTPWPKVERGRALVAGALERAELGIESIFLLDGMSDSRPFADDQLPDTGVGIHWERKLSSLFIATPLYGTRCSTAIVMHRSGLVTFVERTTTPSADGQAPLVREQFPLSV